MKEHLSKINALIDQLSSDASSILKSISTTKTYKKGAFLLQQDEVCRKSFWVEEGIARKFYLNDGKEITTELFFENDLAVSFESYALQKPSREFIQALTNITVWQTDFTAFRDAKITSPKLAELDLLMTEYYAMWLEQRLFEFHTLDATQRYLRLLQEHPHVVQNIPLTYIASYLGISLETLSRIRARI
jgi:CRP-like cAMP-binding protein